jgi:hypothetical protein
MIIGAIGDYSKMRLRIKPPNHHRFVQYLIRPRSSAGDVSVGRTLPSEPRHSDAGRPAANRAACPSTWILMLHGWQIINADPSKTGLMTIVMSLDTKPS